MTIKRDILGTIVNIELTDEEITKAHIAYLEQEIKTLEGAGKTVVTEPRSEEYVMPQSVRGGLFHDGREPKYMSELRECAEELRKINYTDGHSKSLVLDRYDETLKDAHNNGMTYEKIGAVLNVTKQTIFRRVKYNNYPIKAYA